MQYHGAGETMGSIGGRFAEMGAVDGGHDVGGSVADVFGEAVVLVGPVGGTSSQYTAFGSNRRLMSGAIVPSICPSLQADTHADSVQSGTYCIGGTSSTQCPNVPNITLE